MQNHLFYWRELHSLNVYLLKRKIVDTHENETLFDKRFGRLS